MSAKKTAKNTASAAKNLSDKQLRRIWAELKAPVLLERLRVLQPDARWSLAGNQLKARCPYHDDNTPSFHVYLDRGYAKCFGCEKFIWNPIELWAGVKGSSWSDALADLRQQFGIKFLSAQASNQLRAWERNQLLKKRIAAICHDELINAINQPTNPEYDYAQAAVKYLVGTRQLPKDALPSLPMLGVMAPVSRIIERLDQEAAEENVRRVAEAEAAGVKVQKFVSLAEEAKNYLETARGWLGAVFFRLDVAPDAIGRFKLRRPDTKDIHFLADAYEEDLGFLGLGWHLYKPLFGAQQKYCPGVHVVEGEFDCLSVMARQVLAGGPGFIILSAGGSSGGGMIDGLRFLGVEEAYLVGDRPGDVGKGDRLLQDWLPSVRQLRTRIFVGWDHFPGADDPDEAVLTHGLPKFQASMLKVKDRSVFQPPQEWVFDQAQPLLEAIDESDLRLRVETAVEWGRMLKNGVECDAFVEACAKAFGLPAASLKREIVAKEEDEPAFIQRLVDVLNQIFFVIGQRAVDTDRRIYLWHKEKRLIVQVALADEASIERQLGPVLGALYQFLNEKVGVPLFLEPPESKKAMGAYLRDMDSAFRWHMRQALIIMAQDTPDFDTAEHKGQGIHVVRSDQGGPPTLYVVNGRDVYLGTYDTDQKLNWKLLPGPSHNGYIFDVGINHIEEPWMKWVRGPNDLAIADKLDPKDIWQRLYGLLDAGWRFKNHPMSTQFLASHIMASAVCKAFRRLVMVAFHADTKSGKSKILMGLIGGTDFTRIHVLAAAVGMPKFTAAGIRQQMNDKARPLCLDEFEDEGMGDKKSRTISEVLEDFRNLLGENNSITHGTRSGDTVKRYNLNFNVFIAAINKARKVQDANRMVTVYMERVDNRPDPVQILLNEFGGDYIQQLKQELAVCLLPHVAKLQEIYAEIEAEYARPGVKPSTVDSRIFEGLYQSLTVMRFLGLDHKQFAQEFCEANKEVLTVAAGHTDSMELFYWLTQTACIPTRLGEDSKDRYYASLNQMLATPELRREVNLSGTGLFWDEPSKLLVVSWTMAIQRVFAGHARYSKETNVFNLRELANRAPNAVKAEVLEASGALTRLRAQGLAGVPTTHLTAYRMDHIISTLSAPQVFAEDPPASTKSEEGEEPTERKELVDDGDFS